MVLDISSACRRVQTANFLSHSLKSKIMKFIWQICSLGSSTSITEIGSATNFPDLHVMCGGSSSIQVKCSTAQLTTTLRLRPHVCGSFRKRIFFYSVYTRSVFEISPSTQKRCHIPKLPMLAMSIRSLINALA